MANGDLTPAARLRRSFIWRTLDAAGANYAEINDAAVAADFGAPDAEAKAARGMGLTDLSPLARVGFKGNGALQWARDHGVKIGQANNVATRQAGGALAARLADSEVVVIDGLAGKGTLPHRLLSEWSMDNAKGGYLVNRQGVNFWFMATGEHAAAMFAKICGVDLRAHKFAERAIAQTSVARTNCIVIRDDLGAVPAFHMMGDSASAEYQWTCVIDAMVEFAGQPVGLTALRSLAGA
jgi:sarcosine oxidase subunit gamma